MEPVVDRILEKRGIKDVSELSGEEKETFERWNKTLAEGEVTVEKIAQFCERQIAIIETIWRREVAKQEPGVNQKMVVMHTMYKTMLDVIRAPAVERATLLKYLSTLLEEGST